MRRFTDILDTFRQTSFSERDKGSRFEKLIQGYLKTTPLYAGLFDKVWTWSEFPYKEQFGWIDTGIDLVALTYTGEYWAVQCKCYGSDTFITKPDVDTFLATSGRTFDVDGQTVAFSQRLWVSTTNRWNSTAEQTIRNQNPPVSRLNLIELENDDVDWEKIESGVFGKASRAKPFEVREHQRKAIDKTHEYLKTRDRGKLIMACGTGKTFTALKIAENETDSSGLILFLVPSIALLGQTLRSWSQQAAKPIHAVCICSDAQVSKAEEKNEDDSTSTVDLALPASTDTESIVRQLNDIRSAGREGMTVVFSTYQSIDVIAKAQRRLLESTGGEYGVFDLIICDEAHRTTGVTLKDAKESSFVKIHNNDFIQGRKRVYMTATPRLYTEVTKKKAEENDAVLCSMDDRTMYGDEIYRIGFGEAVEKNLLTDYKVLILAVGDKDITPSLRRVMQREDGSIPVDDASKFVGCINALSKRVLGDEGLIKATDPFPMRRAVAFCSTIPKSKLTASVFTNCKEAYMEDVSAEDKERMVDVVAHHVDGTMSATKRDAELMWLKSAPANDRECRMLTNARCLSEGVDVPSLDAVVFVSPKNSQVDVVQSVGRVMRRSEGKKYGYIIIPVVVPEYVEGEDVLDKHPNFKVVWTVLNALRAHDDRFNAEVGKIELSQKKPKHIIFAEIGGKDDATDSVGAEDNGGNSIEELEEQLTLQFGELQNTFYAKMVNKVGTKRYWEQWAKDVAKIAEEHIRHIEELISHDGRHRKTFEQLMKALRRNINPNLSEEEAIEMLSQHIISRPVFEALFGDSDFTKNNPVSKSLQKMLALLDDEAKTEEENEKLQKFYSYVKSTVGDIKEDVARQRLIVEIYDKFFKVASPKTVDKLGIVYTPVEVVDFIIRSVAHILRKEFGRSLGDENVHILDPFTGTGTFVTRLLQSGVIPKEALSRKYANEIHANEIVLMAYYIASINIESVYHSITGGEEYEPFNGICLTDTFQLGEEKNADNIYSEAFPTNSKRVMAQMRQPITVIVGNPPYSVGQKSANDNAQNQSYPVLEKKIETTYVAESRANLSKSVYDSYVKAFKWASERISVRGGGVIGFVTNGAWIDANGLDGMRKCFEKEFSTIYVFNLRGNQRTSGELSRKEGGKIFGSGSRTPIAITILVKHPDKPVNEKARIYYHDIGDYLSREDKLRIIKDFRDISNPLMKWRQLNPNEYGDWINKRSEAFKSFVQMEPEKKFDKRTHSVFTTNVIGVATNRDAWVCGTSIEQVSSNMKRMIEFYNEQRISFNAGDISELDGDEKKISWTVNLKKDIINDTVRQFDDSKFVEYTYRPFFKQCLYYHRPFIERPGLWKIIYPSKEYKNLVISVSGVGQQKPFSSLITDTISDLQVVDKAQYFPLYWYEESNNDEADLFSQPSDTIHYDRRDGVSDYILSEARKQYGTKVKKDDIFYYVYGILHSPDYKKEFASDLKKSLPRIPLVDNPDDFWAFSKAGRTLADLHINYETVEPYSGVEIEGGLSSGYRVDKMRFGKLDSKTPDKSVIVYNSGLTIKKIPLEAYDYIVNGKSAVEWVMERYQVSTDQKSGIVNDPNMWAAEHNDERYIFDLLLRIINVSVRTMEIVRNLPKMRFD